MACHRSCSESVAMAIRINRLSSTLLRFKNHVECPQQTACPDRRFIECFSFRPIACQNFGKRSHLFQNLRMGMEKDETIDNSLDFAADEVNWSGPLAANILKVTINQAVAFNNVSDLSVSGYRRWAYNNCNRMILFNKDHR